MMRPMRQVHGKTVILAVLIGLALVVGGVFWAGLHGGSTHIPQSKPGVSLAVPQRTEAPADAATSAPSSGAAGTPSGRPAANAESY
jgi:hypothetical protein